MNFTNLLQVALTLICHTLSQAALADLTYAPEKLNRATAKIVVVIHGCLQSAESMALGTGWNQIADKNNLVILYPQVPADSNGLDCWNWYLPENQTNKSGQLLTVRNSILSTKKKFDIPQAAVFVTGISSGAATTAGLLACFPEDFVAGAIHSGPSYGLAQTLEDSAKVLRDGPATSSDTNTPTQLPCKAKDFKGGVMVLQGSLDKVVNPKNADRVISDFIPDASKSNESQKLDGGLTYKTEDFTLNGKVRGRLVMIRGLGHAWSGYTQNLRHATLLGPGSLTPTKVPFFEKKGPSSTNLIWDFFKSQNP